MHVLVYIYFAEILTVLRIFCNDEYIAWLSLLYICIVIYIYIYIYIIYIGACVILMHTYISVLDRYMHAYACICVHYSSPACIWSI